MSLFSLPTLAEVQAARAGKPILKPKTRLEETIAQRPLTHVDHKTFKTAVWSRDRNRCRCCGRRVNHSMSRVPQRGEVHHIHGRVGDLRFEPRSALLLCLVCHERVTGKVNAHRLVIVPSRTFVIRQGTFTDARYPVQFKECA